MATRYAVSFDTKDAKGRIKAVWVEMGHFWMKSNDDIRVDLCDHPLYEHLESYVLANPSRARCGD